MEQWSNANNGSSDDSKKPAQRPVMERMESKVVAGEGEGAAPERNSTTNAADAETSQSLMPRNKHEKQSESRTAQFADAADDDSMPNPASSWLPYSDQRATEYDALVEGKWSLESLPAKLEQGRRKMCRIPQSVSSFATYRVQQLMLSNTAVKLVSVFAFAAPLVLVGGELYSWATGKPLSEGFLKIYSVLYIVPGVNVLAESTLGSALLINAIFLLGTFFFAVVLGVVSDDIASEVKAIRSGNYPVITDDHIVVLNWNRQTVPLLRQLAVAQSDKGSRAKHRQMVIMAERDKEEMDLEVKAALAGYRIDWQTRSGAPYAVADLDKVSAGRADTVILLRPDGCDNAATREVAAILGINSGRDQMQHTDSKPRQQSIIVQAPSDGTDVVTAAKRVIVSPSLNALGLQDKQDITRLIAQSALQPGVASVHCAVLQKSSGSACLYLKDAGDLVGLSMGEVRRRFRQAVICGYFRSEKAEKLPVLNPPDEDELQEGDKIIALARTSRFRPSDEGICEEYQACVGHLPLADSGSESDSGDNGSDSNGAGLVAAKRKSLVVAGWCGELDHLMSSLRLFAPYGSEVTVICECLPEGLPDEEQAGCVFKHLPGLPLVSSVLEEAGVATADAVIIGPADDLPDEQADAQMMSMLMLIQDILISTKRERSRPAHVVAVVRCPQSVKVANYMVRDLAQGTMTAELLQPDELVAGLIAQVTSEPDLAPVLSTLIDAGGQEVRLRDPSAYSLDDVTPITFACVAERARLHDETAIGFVTRQGALVLAPDAGDMHVYRNTDHVVVFGSSS
ncbi:hypothetical protein WJX72_000188 [[Myrmecia] bisecta]|uniref:CASTOR/POLLUX/SYM8 ion channel conserved domain-containing protein n=1 Tax=[Myrmecia] bisecta TaxID=41462 RepID=A0AAW1PZH4_9CHLO